MKYISFLIIILLVNCTVKIGKNTEIFCPYQPPILIKFTSEKNIKKSVIRNIREGDNNIIIFKLDDNRTFSIKIIAANINDCNFVESNYGIVDQNYVHSFWYFIIK